MKRRGGPVTRSQSRQRLHTVGLDIDEVQMMHVLPEYMRYCDLSALCCTCKGFHSAWQNYMRGITLLDLRNQASIQNIGPSLVKCLANNRSIKSLKAKDAFILKDAGIKSWLMQDIRNVCINSMYIDGSSECIRGMLSRISSPKLWVQYRSPKHHLFKSRRGGSGAPEDRQDFRLIKNLKRLAITPAAQCATEYALETRKIDFPDSLESLTLTANGIDCFAECNLLLPKTTEELHIINIRKQNEHDQHAQFMQSYDISWMTRRNNVQVLQLNGLFPTCCAECPTWVNVMMTMSYLTRLRTLIVDSAIPEDMILLLFSRCEHMVAPVFAWQDDDAAAQFLDAPATTCICTWYSNVGFSAMSDVMQALCAGIFNCNLQTFHDTSCNQIAVA